MKTREAIAKAIDTRNAGLAGRIADTLRGRGFTYARVLEAFQEVRPQLTAGDFEELMAEADELETA